MINLTVVIDNDEAVRKLHELQKVAKETTSSVVKDSERMDATWRQMRNTIMSVTAGLSLAGLAKQVVSVRGEVQQLEVAFETMLGSKQKADQMMSEIIELAAKTPFGLQDVSNGAKMLLAYGSAAEEVVDEIKMLGNIASGLSIPLNDLIYLYGTTRTQGRMFTQDLRQFMGRGIPLAEELAKQFGVAKDEVGGLVTAGRVGFEEMREALVAMTSEGGKFNDLMEKQSQTISGQISNLGDSIYQMFNEIGESSEGVINDILTGASWVVEHYKEILNVLKYLVVAYGSYKAALMLVAAGHKAMALVRFAGDLFNAARGVKSLTAAVKALGVATKANPIGLLLSGVSLLVTALIDFNDEAPEAAKQMGEMERAAREEYEQVNLLAGMLKDTNLSEKQRKEILEELKGISPKIVEGIDAEALAYDRLTENIEAYNEEQKKAIQYSVLGDEYKQLTKRVADAEAALTTNTLDIAKEAQKYYTGDEWKATFRTDAKGGMMVNPEWANEYFELVEQRIRENEGNSLALANALRDDILNGEATKINPYFFVKGSTLTDWAEHRTRLEAELEAAKAALEEYVTLYPQIAEELNLVSEGTGEADRLYTEELQEAAEAYKKEYDKLQALLSNPAATALEVSDARETLKSAEDKYKSLGGKTFDEQKKEEERREADAEKAAEEERKKEQERAKMLQDLRFSIEQERIDGMTEGANKEIAQIRLNYDKRIATIDEEERRLHEAMGGTLTDDQSSIFQTRRANALQEANKAEEKVYKDAEMAMNEHLIKYGTLQEQLLATTSKYNMLIAEAKTEGARLSLEAERDAILADYEVQASDFAESIVHLTTEKLSEMAKDLQAELDAKEDIFYSLDSSTTQDATKLREEINRLKAQIKLLKNEADDAGEAVTNRNWEEGAQLLQDICNTAEEAAGALELYDSGLASVLRTMIQLAGTALNVVNVIQGVASATSAAGASISAMEKASVILAIIGAVIQVVTTLFEIFSQTESPVEKTRREFEALNTELERLHKLARIDSVTGTIFGEDAFGNFTNNLSLLQDFNNDLLDIQERIRKRGMEIASEFGVGGLDELVPDKADLTKVQHEWQSFYESIANMQVQTRHSTWFRSAKYQSLGSLYPELFEGGELSLDGLKKLQESELYSKLSAENRELIDELIANWEAYNDTLEATNEYMRDVFGDVGESIGDALTAAFEKGTEAAKEMSDAISDIVENLVKDMAYAALLQPIMDDAMTAVGELNDRRGKGEVGDEEYTNELIGIVGDIIDDAKGVKDQWSALLEAAQDAGEDAGLSLFDGESDGQSATSKGFAAMSQETGDELNGRFTDIQGKVSGIYEGLQFLKQLDAESLKKTESISQTVAMIHNDTMLIEKHTRVLADMDHKLEQIRKNTEGL